jgi:hypothetical protein
MSDEKRGPAVPQLPPEGQTMPIVYGTAKILGELIESVPATDGLIDAWFIETHHNIGLGTEAFNRFYRAKEDLKARIRAALTK